jgi:hypothetical protein
MAEKEYIEREAAIAKIKDKINEYPHNSNPYWISNDDYIVRGLREAIKIIDEYTPTANVQEVRHGEWVKNQEDMYWGNYFIRRNCSICGGSPFYQEGLGTYKLTPYCPHCGAKMDKE